MDSASHASLFVIIMRCLAFFGGIVVFGAFCDLFRMNLDASDLIGMDNKSRESEDAGTFLWGVVRGRLTVFLVALVVEVGLVAMTW